MTAPGRDVTPATSATVTGIFAGAELRVGELVAGRFRIEELLGIGGMGVVYRAHDEQLHVPVALKLLRPELAARPDAFARFRQELLLARQVSSAHVVRIHDIVTHEGRWLISMDFVPGVSLEHYLDTNAPLSVDTTLKIARQLALGLVAAHQRKVVHRDLKPANVLLTDALDAYITDFGVARSAGVTGITASGVVVGTPEYLSPEQARAEDIDHRSDLYTLGLMMFEMLTGKLPFNAGTPAEMLAQRIVKSPAPVARFRADVPHWVNQLVQRLTQLKPARRLQDAEAVVRAIDEKRVPGQLPAPRTAMGVTAVLAVGLAVAWFAMERIPQTRTQAPATPAAVPAAPAPAARTGPELALLPIASAPADAALAAALDELMVEAVLASGTAGVDGLRTARALRQLGYDGEGARRNAARLAETLGAESLLSGRLEREDGRLVLVLSRLDPQRPDTPLREARTGAVTVDALQPAVMQALSTAGALGARSTARSALAWPQGEPALRAFGEGVLAWRTRNAQAGLQAHTRATETEPAFALAWQRRMELAQLVLGTRGATDAARDTLAALRGARGRDAERARGLASLLAGDADAAIQRLQPLAEAAPLDHPTRVLYARALVAADRGEEARAELVKVVAADPQDADALFALGRESVRAGEAQRGVDDYLARAQVLFNRLGDERGQADTLNALGVGYERLGQLGPAARNFADAAALREKLGDAAGAAKALRNLAWARAVQGDTGGAQADLQRARKLLGSEGDDAAMADLVNDEGLIAEQRGDFRAALVAYREALRLRQPLGDPSATAESMTNLGFAYHQSGEFDNALAYLSQARDELAKARDIPGEVRTAQSLALLDIDRGDWAGARTALAATVARAEQNQMVEELGVSLAYLAELDRLEGRVDEALAHAKAADEKFAQRADQRGAAEMALLRAALYLDLGAWTQAEAALAPLAAKPPESGEQAALAQVRRSELALGRGDAVGVVARECLLELVRRL